MVGAGTIRWRGMETEPPSNRATMHRARPFEDATHRRELRRVTTLDVEPPALVPSRA